jgi:RNA polymerase sporulation-specific sigma factor
LLLIILRWEGYSEIRPGALALETMDISVQEMKIFNDNFKLVKTVIKKYQFISRDEYDDLFQEGCLGLLKAICKYKEDKNTKFTTFAYTCIDNEIKMYLRKRKKFFKDVVMLLEEDFQIETDGTANRMFNGYRLVSSTENNPEECFIDKEEVQSVRQLLSKLTDQKRELIFSFFGLGGKKREKQSELARKFQVSQGRISKKIKTILGQMQKQTSYIS